MATVYFNVALNGHHDSGYTEGTYFGAQHILDPANNSSWAWHTVAAMLAIWDYPKSWAHLATLPFPKPEELGDAQKICWTHMT